MPKNPYQPRKMAWCGGRMTNIHCIFLVLGLPCMLLVLLGAAALPLRRLRIFRTFTGEQIFDDWVPPAHCKMDQYDDSIEVLSLKGCKLEELPSEINRFKRLKRLDAANNRLKDLPPLPKSLEIAFFLGNEFEELPTSLSTAENLMMLSFKSNQIRSVPKGVLPSSLKWLILTGNKLSQLPADMGRLKKLRKVMLSNNQLESLPASMAECEDIELLRLANNNFLALPSFVTSLPKLAFLAVAGNPAIQQPSSWGKGSEIDITSLALQEVLGEGTSGIVYKSSYQGADVAVKVGTATVIEQAKSIN
jgi:hypothetical protein